VLPFIHLCNKDVKSQDWILVFSSQGSRTDVRNYSCFHIQLIHYPSNIPTLRENDLNSMYTLNGALQVEQIGNKG
jgi:hypothetical protein